MSPTPSPIDVFIHSAPAADWQVWAAFAPLIAAVVAGLIAAAALMQKRRADNRAEWWRRAQWALDASLSKESSKSELGQKAIEFLSKSRLATPEDGALLKIGTEDPLAAANLARLAEAGEAAGVANAAEVNGMRVDGPRPTRDNETDRNDGNSR